MVAWERYSAGSLLSKKTCGRTTHPEYPEFHSRSSMGHLSVSAKTDIFGIASARDHRPSLVGLAILRASVASDIDHFPMRRVAAQARLICDCV